MSNIKSWNGTAASNNATPPDGFPEGMAPSTYNDGCREVMAAIKRLALDTGGSVLSGGSSNAYTLSSNQSLTALADGDDFTFEANHTNTGAATLNVDAIGAVDIVDLAGADPHPGAIIAGAKYRVVYDGTNFVLLNPRWYPDAVALGSDLFKRKTADQTKNNDATFAADTHLTGFNLVAGGVYELESLLFYNTYSNPDISIALSFSSAPTSAAGRIHCAAYSGLVDRDTYITDLTDTSKANFAFLEAFDETNDACATLDGLIVANAATTMELHWAQSSAVAVNTVLRAHSFIRLRRLA